MTRIRTKVASRCGHGPGGRAINWDCSAFDEPQAHEARTQQQRRVASSAAPANKNRDAREGTQHTHADMCGCCRARTDFDFRPYSGATSGRPLTSAARRAQPRRSDNKPPFLAGASSVYVCLMSSGWRPLYGVFGGFLGSGKIFIGFVDRLKSQFFFIFPQSSEREKWFGMIDGCTN